MVAPQIIDIMEAIEAAVTPLGLRMTIPTGGSIVPPAGLVTVPDIDDYRLTMRRGTYRVNLGLIVMASAAWDRPGQQLLAEYASVTGERSIPAAIEADRTLGGVVQDAIVSDFANLGLEEVAAIQFFGGKFTISCLPRGI